MKTKTDRIYRMNRIRKFKIGLIPLILSISLLAFSAACTNEQLSSPAGQSAIAEATTIATSVLDAWLNSHPFGTAQRTTAAAARLTADSPAVTEPKAKAKEEIRRIHPELTPATVDRIVRKAFAERLKK